LKAATRAYPHDELPSGNVDIEWLTTSDLDPLAAEWRALEDAVTHRTHLCMFDFLAPWYRHYAGDYGGAPLIGLARRNGRLVGVAPLMIRGGSVGRIPVTRIEFAPTDVPAGEFLVEDRHPEIVEAFIASLAARGGFDVICLDGFETDSPHLAALRSAAARHRMTMDLDDHAYAVVHLREGYKAYVAGLSGHYRRNLKQKARKIESAGAEVSGIHLTADPGTVEEAIRRLIAVNEASYKLEGQRLADHHRNFLADVIRRLASRGRLALPLLSIGGRDAAFILGVLDRNCFYDITLSYDEQFAKVSPGAYLMQRVLEKYDTDGIHTVVSHGAHDYKKHWASEFVPQKRAFLFAPTVRARATRMIRFGLRPLLQRYGFATPQSET
jgi:CelD/BcsL family acetyltransferase involved in cellulose biosynthesis